MKIIHTDNNDFDKCWGKGLLRISGLTPMYSLSVRRFDLELFSSTLERDDSFIVLSDSGEAVALVPLYCFKDISRISEYRYGREYLRSPLIYGSPYTKEYEKIQKYVFAYIENLAEKNKVKAHKTMIEGIELLEGRHYYNYLTDFGYIDESSVCHLIDTSRDIKELWADVRKSYKHLINRADKNYVYETISAQNYDFDRCEDYRKLHFKASGRQTRSLESFYLMYKMIEDNQAFLIIAKGKDGSTAAAQLFYYSKDYSLYASSAINPDLPADSGAGHLAIWQGIVTAKRLGLRFLDMGQLRISSNISEKEKNIALFKKGFGGNTVTVFRGTKIFTN